MTNQDIEKFSLSKRDKLKSGEDINEVFQSGKTIFSGNKRVRAVYLLKDENHLPAEVKAAFAVSKRAGKAFWRNRVKRLLRESYRLNKGNLINTAIDKKKTVHIVFSAGYINQRKNKKIVLSDIFDDVVELISRITKSLDSN